MSEFREYKLSELGKWLGGGTPSKAKKEYWLDGTIPWVSPKDMKKLRIDSSADYITQIAVEKTSAKLIPKGSVLIVTRSGILQRYVPIAINEVPVTINQDLKVIIPNGKIRSDFLANSLRLQNNRVLHECAKVGTTVESLGTDLLKGFKIVAPDIDVQDRIMAIIGTWDEAISKTEKLIHAKKRYKKGLMQRLLSGKVRFPEFEVEDWVEVKLGEVFKERNDKGFDDLKLVAITTKNGVIDRDELDRRDTSSDDKSNYKRILPGDIGYNTMRMWQGVSGYSELEGIVSPAYTIVTPVEEKVAGLFMSYLFKHPPVIDLFRRYSQGLVSDTLNLKYKNFAQIKLMIPPSIEEQKKIACVFMEIDNEINLIKKEVALYQKQKKGLMQQLLTGKVRVN